MTAITENAIRNGVDTQKMFATLDLIKEQPELARFQFRATNRWIDGAHNRSTIQGFYAAGGEDTSRSESFEIDAGEPAMKTRSGGASANASATGPALKPPSSARVGRIADVRLDHGRVDPRRAGPKAPLALRLGDEPPGQLRHHLGAQPAGELSDRRLVRHPLVDRDQAEAAQMKRVGDLPDEGLVAPAVALLYHHQPHVGLHRDRCRGRIRTRARAVGTNCVDGLAPP